MPLAPIGTGPLPERRAAIPASSRHRRAYAALDLGTNNCRLLIARPAPGGGFTVIDAFSRVVRLGEGLMQTGALSEAAQERAVAALRICAEKLRRREVWLTRNVATEACRAARNGADFVDRVYTETGIALDVISPAEEARLAVLDRQLGDIRARQARLTALESENANLAGNREVLSASIRPTVATRSFVSSA